MKRSFIKRIRSFLFIFTTLAVLVLFSGCVSVLHEIFRDSSGNIHTKIRITVSRQLLDAMKDMGGEDESDDFFDLGDEQMFIKSENGYKNIRTSKIDTNLETGIQIDAYVPGIKKDIDPLEKPFVPVKQGNSLLIGIPPMDDKEKSASEGDGMTDLFFASSKYQLLLDKKIFPEASTAQIFSTDGNIPVTLLSVNGNWLVEFPVAFWFDSSDGFIVKLDR
jgi:hypothetical protein